MKKMKIPWEDHCWPCRSVWRPLWVRCSRGGPCCVRLGTGTPGRPSLASRGPGFKGPWITPGLALGPYPGESFEMRFRCCKTLPSLAGRKHALATLWLWVFQKFPNLSSWRRAPSPNAFRGSPTYCFILRRRHIFPENILALVFPTIPNVAIQQHILAILWPQVCQSTPTWHLAGTSWQNC